MTCAGVGPAVSRRPRRTVPRSAAGLEPGRRMTEVASPAFAFGSRRSVTAPRRDLRRILRGLGFVREVGVAYLFGTSAAADRLNVAFVVASLATIVGGEASTRPRSFAVQSPDARIRRARLRSSDASEFPSGSDRHAALRGGGSPGGAPDGRRVGERAEGRSRSWFVPRASVGAGIASGTHRKASCSTGGSRRMNAAQLCYSAGAIAGLAVVEFGDAGPAAVAAGWSAGNLAGLLVLFRGSPQTQPGEPRSGARRARALRHRVSRRGGVHADRTAGRDRSHHRRTAGGW